MEKMAIESWLTRLPGLLALALTCSLSTLSAQTAPTFTAQPTNQTVLAGSNATFAVAVSGTSPFTYQWQFNGTNLPNNIIATIAGGGSNGYAGDGGAAVTARLNYPSGMVSDFAGNLYIADTTNSRIRKVDTNGIMTTVAGNNFNYPLGDGGPATNAGLFGPTALALDVVGDLFISDTIHNRIRKMDPNGTISTVAGKTVSGFSGDGGPATNANLSHPSGVCLDLAGNLYFADSANNCVRKVDTTGTITTAVGGVYGGYAGDGGPAIGARLSSPSALAIDASGSLYIADTGNARVRKVDTNGTITTVAGNGIQTYAGDTGMATNASLYSPNGLTVDAFGSIYLADARNYRIRKVDSYGFVNTIVGNGSSSFLNPLGVALDGAGNLLIADQVFGRIRKVLLYSSYPALTLASVNASNAGSYTVVVNNAYGSVTSTVAVLTVEAPPIITVQPASLTALLGSNPTLLVAAAGSGPLTYLWYFGGTNLVQSSPDAAISLPSISTNNAGGYSVVITNAYGSVTSQTATLTVALPPSIVTPPGTQTASAGSGVDLIVSAGGSGPFSYQWLHNGTNFLSSIITTVVGNGTAAYAGDGGPATNASLNGPQGVAVDALGELIIIDTSNQCVRLVGTNGIITTVAGNGVGAYSGDGGPATNASLNSPRRAALDAYGNLFISDFGNYRIRKVGANGIITSVAGTGISTNLGDGDLAVNASIGDPSGLTLDAAGDLFIAETLTYRVQEVNAQGIITTIAGVGPGGLPFSGDGGPATSAHLGQPFGLALDAAGELYISDSANHRVRKVDTNGIITTVAGNGFGFTGDGYPATSTGLGFVFGATVDRAGDLIVADTSDNRILIVKTNGILYKLAGNGTGTFAGDGGLATNASLKFPYDVAFDAAGNLYIADGSNNRIRKVQLAGFPTVNLTNVTSANAGSYTVVVTSPWGSVTSAVATLTVNTPTTPPQFTTNDVSFGFLTNRFGFNITGAFGQTIIIDASTDFLSWTPLFTNSASGNPAYFFDPASSNLPSRFYRGRLQ